MKSFAWAVAGLMVWGFLIATAEPPAAAATRTPSESLKACETLYAEAKTYQDTGDVKTEFTVMGRLVSDTKPFSTAFERGARFAWQFEHSATPGAKPNQRYMVWSSDQKSFQSSWTLDGSRDNFDAIDDAMAGPTGISGGSATAVIPLLAPTMRWGVRVTDLKDAVEKPAETIDGVHCTVISGVDGRGGSVTLWLDPAMAIRRIHSVHEIDPDKISGAQKVEKFTAITTITIKPVFNDDIADEHFAAPVPSGKPGPAPTQRPSK